MPTDAPPAAVLWDFDGTLVDTEPIWADVQIEMLARRGVVWTHEDMGHMVGMSARGTAELMAEAVQGREPTARFVDELLDEMEATVAERVGEALPWLPGARRLFGEVAAAGVPSAVVTASSDRIMASALAHLNDHVNFVVTGDDVTRPKPDPEGYLQAMERLGVEARDVLIFEDSVPGTQAALATGALVYAVPALARLTPHPRMHIREDGLGNTSWADIVSFWNESRT